MWVSKRLESLGDVALKNVHVLKEAWVPFGVWCIGVVGVVWSVTGAIYATRLENAQSTISVLNARLTTATGEIQDLRTQLATRASSNLKVPHVDLNPDEIYQFGSSVAKASSGEVKRSEGVVHFPTIVGGADFNINAYFEYRQFYMGVCSFTDSTSQKNLGVLLNQGFSNVTCKILAPRP